MKTLNKIKEKQKYSLLNLDDIEILVNFYNQEQYLNELKEILEKEIRERPQCIEELYEDENLISEELRYTRPNPNNLRDVLREKFHAVILNEYQRQYNKIADDYINKRITYNQYKQKTNRLDKKTFDLVLKVKIIYINNEKN
jgi:tRNA 2-selenouridine synthase SelU